MALPVKKVPDPCYRTWLTTERIPIGWFQKRHALITPKSSHNAQRMETKSVNIIHFDITIGTFSDIQYIYILLCAHISEYLFIG